MKKLLLLFLVIAGVFGLAACKREFEIAMITDSGDIDDRSFNQGTWEGIEAYAEENDISYKYYKPTEVSFDAYVAAIDLAVSGGAKVIVTPGFLFENSVHKAQTLYPEVTFIIIDGAPNNVSDWGTDPWTLYEGDTPDFTIADNTLSIFFQEEQSGFLAGYAAYQEGLTNMGFMGGQAVPAVVRFGVGFAAGAYYAAKEANDMDYEFDANFYEYLNTFQGGADIVSKADAWYSGGIDVIHAAAGGAGSSVMTSAQNAEKWMIGVDVDQSSINDYVLTSATKGLAVAVTEALEDYYGGTFEGERSITLGAADDAVGLPTSDSSWRFETFTIAQYNTIFAMVADGDIDIPTMGSELGTFITDLGFTANEALATKATDY
ncbi:hypothetical protein BK011_02855 [Tenericutes bacterium MZ-XQ]|jgi:basic membrane protein A|nr:hypothetical protein BK011_02855 [Tenericutes bacterium MZ-XQ]